MTYSYLLFLDLETTGLEVEQDVIVEAAYDLREDAGACETSLSQVSCVLATTETRIAAMSEFVAAMHEASGLLGELRGLGAPGAGRLTPADFEEIVLAAINAHCEADSVVRLAGDSVHFDRSFIARHMPALHRRLSHQHVDVSAAERALGLTRQGQAEHRAAADVASSVEALQRLRKIGVRELWRLESIDRAADYRTRRASR